MTVLKNLEPQSVFRYFEEICAIPHGSGNTKAISDYLVEFAKRHGLEWKQDSSDNVIIRKGGTAGYEEAATVMIQGHIDMVCEKEPGCEIDFQNDGLKLRVDDGIISAEGTTLGGDDGIAVAYALAILDADDIPHPPLEAVFTSDEEIGMLGAAALDMSPLKAKYMLNVDSEDEGYLLVSCAGGATAVSHLPVIREKTDSAGCTDGTEAPAYIHAVLTVGGCLGGHSGMEIDKGRANANQVLGRVLYELGQIADLRVISANGGKKDNAIPAGAAAELLIAAAPDQADKEKANKEKADKEKADREKTDREKTDTEKSDKEKAESGNDIRELLSAKIREMNGILQGEYAATDSGIRITLQMSDNEPELPTMTKEMSERLITLLYTLPGGIQRMSPHIEGLVQTSLNLGILETAEQEVTMSFSVRSSVESEKLELISRMKALTEQLGGYVSCSGEYPAWEYKEDSPLRDLMVQVFEEQYGRKPVVQAIHAGVECGLFSGKMPGLDCVSFGPDMKEIHTPRESMDTASVLRTWNYLLEVLRRLK